MSYPNLRQWELFEVYKNYPQPMHPLTFQQHWDVSPVELTRLTGVSLTTVNHWFSTGETRRKPALHCCRRLAEINFIWLNAKRISPDILRRWRGAI